MANSNEQQLIAAACASVDAEVTQVLASRVTDSEVIIVVDNGISGCPKYKIPIDSLKSGKRTAAKKGE